MSYQPKVTHTQKYGDSQGNHTVVVGKLILISNYKLDEHHDPIDYFLDEGLPIFPLLISEKEEVNKGEAMYSINDHRIVESVDFSKDFDYKDKIDFGWRKVLALPEQFSERHLQAIEEGKIKDEDKVFVKCDYTDCERDQNGDCIENPNCIQWLHSQTNGIKKPNNVDCGMRPIIHLDQNNHITLFRIDPDLDNAAFEWAYKGEHRDYFDDETHVAEKAFKAGAKWAKKNNY